jgi:DNA-binding NarL/FixJ family response regulator
MTKLVIIDDQEVFRAGLSAILTRFDKYRIIAEGSNGLDLLEILKNFTPDVVLMDINMPKMDGIEASQRALQQFPQLKILIFSLYDDFEYYNSLVDNGVKGFIIKDTSIGELTTAIDAIHSGRTFFSQSLLQNLLRNKTYQSPIDLTQRELEVLDCIARGFSTEEMADTLHISFRTVEKHRANLLSKTNTSNSLKLLIYAIKNGMVKI